MKEQLKLTETFPVSPEEIYTAWLSSEGHTAMTGGEAHCTAIEGDSYTAWDGYIEGTNLELHPHIKIVQSWRTSEFGEDEEDSRLEIHLKAVKGGTELTLLHTGIPEGQTQYEKGWVDHYFTPMKEFFSPGQKV